MNLHCFKLHRSQFYLICQMFAKFSGVESERTISKFRKKKYNFCLAFTCPIKWVCKIRKFHVAAVQRWKRIMQRAWWTFSLLSPSSLVLFSCRNNSATMVMWRHTSPLYSTKFRKTMNQYSLVTRPVRAIRVTRGGLEPSAIAQIFPTSLTGDVTSEIAEDDWERGWNQ